MSSTTARRPRPPRAAADGTTPQRAAADRGKDRGARGRPAAGRGAVRVPAGRTTAGLVAASRVAALLRRARERIRHASAPVTDVVGPLGWLLLGLVALLATLGTALGWDEAVIAAVLGAVLLLLAVAFILGRSAYEVELDLARTRVAVGDRAVGGVTVANASDRTLLPAALELPVGASTALFHLPRLRPGQEHEDLFSIPTQRRAVIVVGPVRSVRQDPLGLLRRQVTWTDPTDLYVHPRTTPLTGSAAGFIKDLEGLPTRELSNADVSFHALREYVPGDDRRHIHWKTTARTNTLMVRQFEETRRSHLAVALSVTTAEYDGEAAFELAVSVAASIGLQALREQRNLSVLTQDGPLRSETGRALLDAVTRIEGRVLRATAVDLARTTADAVPNASVVFLVVGASVTPSQLRSAAASIPPGIRCLAIRCIDGAPAARASIGDLTVLTLGDLDDLALVLRKAAA
ncbi:DUF58 domain-containing protein [Arthrobacter bussei]|uniref:DUF58 domain-containing protein n=1 Tax=Arthrobacter bussei TaxID=2594179 RepID=A0A7X1NS06_9MICC|nr:DUF58 domain-containing protein [Arthrobacter bussei]MPY11713.1 DUF58 domain-containing protein [Arthrobacter bussei]